MSETLETALRVFIFRNDEFIGSEAFLGENSICVGRSENAALRLAAPTVSREHCALLIREDRVFVEDRSSGNGTRVNGRRIGERVAVKPIDAIQIGPFELKVRHLTARPPFTERPAGAAEVTRIEPLLAQEKPVDFGVLKYSSPSSRGGAAWEEETEEEGMGAPPRRPLACAVGSATRARGGSEAMVSPQPLVRAGLTHLRALEGALFPDAPEAPAPRPLVHPDSGPADPWVPGGELALAGLFDAAEQANAEVQSPPGRPRAGAAQDDPWPVGRAFDPPSPIEACLVTPRPHRLTGISDPNLPAASPAWPHGGVEVFARQRGACVGCALLRRPGDQYILGYPTPQGEVAPAPAHLGLRLLRVRENGGVDLVFPWDVGGYVVRGATTALLPDLTEGRKYSCLQLQNEDVATVVLGTPSGRISYHIRFVDPSPRPQPTGSSQPTGAS